MIETYKAYGTDIAVLHPHNVEKSVWIDVVDPTQDEIAQVAEKVSIPADDILDSLDPDERPRFEFEEDYFLLMLRVPATKDTGGGPYHTVPVGCFCRTDKLVTVHSSNVDMVSYFNSRRRKRVVESAYDILRALLGSTLRRFGVVIGIVQHQLSGFRTTILKSMKTESVEDAFELNNELIFLSGAVYGNMNAIRQMLHHRHVKFPETLEDRLEDIDIDTRQQWEMLSMYRELLTNTLDAYMSAISNNLSLVLKIIASLSLILMLPTLIASLYGMNLDLPLAGTPYAFWMILTVSVAWSLALWVIFRKKDWL